MGHWMHTHLSFLAMLATLCSVTGSKADTIEGRVLDIPLPYPDGSIRFHVLPDGRAVRPGNQAGTTETATRGSVQFTDRFDAGRDPRWLDVVGRTEASGGTLRSVSDGSVTIVNGLVDARAKVRVRALTQHQFGIVLRYENNDNYVLAFFEPVQKIIAVHERRNGNFGPHVTSARVEGVAAGPVTLETEIAGPDLKLVFRDSRGATWRAACRLGTLVHPGAVGIYCDQASAKGAQQFDDFEVQTSRTQETAFDPAKSGFVALPVGSPGRPLVLFQETFDGRHPDSFSAVVGAAAEVDGMLQFAVRRWWPSPKACSRGIARSA